VLSRNIARKNLGHRLQANWRQCRRQVSSRQDWSVNCRLCGIIAADSSRGTKQELQRHRHRQSVKNRYRGLKIHRHSLLCPKVVVEVSLGPSAHRRRAEQRELQQRGRENWPRSSGQPSSVSSSSQSGVAAVILRENVQTSRVSTASSKEPAIT
jgi:hypothetical protein